MSIQGDETDGLLDTEKGGHPSYTHLSIGDGLSIANSEYLDEALEPNDWEFAGWGTETILDDIEVDEEAYKLSLLSKKKKEMGQILATAIAGMKLYPKPG